LNDTTSISHALSFDVEEWFHAHSLKVPEKDWERHPSRLDRPVDDILNTLERFHARATFFVLGWVAERRADLVRRIHSAGHEIGCHGLRHQRVDQLSRTDFREDVQRAKQILEEIIANPVFGYRAPSYSIGAKTPWAFEELESAGYQYDSSVYPGRGSLRFQKSAFGPRGPYLARPDLWEFPLPSARLFGRNIPAASGAFLRLMPLKWTFRAIDGNAALGNPSVVNMHPWEFDVEQPRPRVGLLTAIRHRGGIGSMRSKFTALLGRYRFSDLRSLLDVRKREGHPV